MHHRLTNSPTIHRLSQHLDEGSMPHATRRVPDAIKRDVVALAQRTSNIVAAYCYGTSPQQVSRWRQQQRHVS